MTDEKLFGWSFKQWTLFFGFQLLIFGLGTGFAIAFVAETGKNPLDLFAYGSGTSFNVLVNSNGTDLIDSGGSIAHINGGQFFNLAPGCYRITLAVNYLAKQISINSEKIDPSLC